MENENEDNCPIQQLPYEVLCKIFDYLNVSSVKKCSRTCRRWRDIIFSDDYIKRFKLSLELPLYSGRLTETLKQSNRLYSSVDLQIGDNTITPVSGCLFAGIYTIFCYPKLEQLVTLKLSIPIVMVSATRMIMDAIRQMNVLRELHLDASGGPVVLSHQMVQFVVYNHSIQLLVANAIVPIVAKAPKLSSLRITIYDIQAVPVTNEKLLYSSQLPNLKHLEFDKSSTSNNSKLANRRNVDHVLRFFRNLTSLETLKLKNVHVPGYLFKAICEHCTNLTELFIESLTIIDTSTMRNISKLVNLRHLTFSNIKCLEPVAFWGVQLTNLESLAIGSFPILYETLAAFKFATKITILEKSSPSRETDLMVAIASKMPNLKHIELEYFSDRKLELMNLLENVEVLTIRFPISSFMCSQCTVTNIKEIHSLNVMPPTDAHIERLRAQFPKLQLIKAGKEFKQHFLN